MYISKTSAHILASVLFLIAIGIGIYGSAHPDLDKSTQRFISMIAIILIFISIGIASTFGLAGDD